MNYTFSQIANIIPHSKKIIHQENNIHSVYIDTRQISNGENALFVAITSAKNDGHKYIHHAYQKGVRHFIVQYLNDDILINDANYLVVDDSIRALQELALYHRKQFNIPVIGITGSNGKTIVKEWLYFLLKDDYNICRSPKSFNSQIGVPLSILNLDPSHTLGIFEAGISLPREMNVLEKIIQPDIAILTHFGSAHSEGFSDDNHKLKEKLKLFQNSKINIIQRYQHSFLQQQSFPLSFICISENPKDKVVAHHSTQNNLSIIDINIEKKKYQIQIPFVNEASIKNAITCFVSIYYLNSNLIDKIIPKFSQLPAVSLRMEIKKGKFQSTIISDYYNSDIDSFEISMSYLKQYSPNKNKILILSDFEEIKDAEKIYKKAVQIINHSDLSHIVFIGNEWKNYLHLIQPHYSYYSTTYEFIDNYFHYSSQIYDSAILLKGARKFEFEKIAHLLEQKTHDTILEINIPALWHNLNYFKNLIGKNIKIMCMLKAAGYGSGSVEMAYALQKFGIDYIAVAYADEGVELKQAGIQLPIMVMLPEKNAFDEIIQNGLEPEIYSFDILHHFIEALDKQGIQQYPIHIKLDTGMHRLGFLSDEIDMLINVVKKHSAVFVKSIFSHFAASENDEHNDYTLHQIKLLQQLSEKIEKNIGYTTIKHICNSAAVKRFPQAHFDMIRLGIGMYGISDNTEEQKQLQNVLSLKTIVAQIKYLKKGDSIGYNRNALLEKDSKIAVIPIGYADGFSRKLGNQQFQVKYKNNLINTIGNVCMDMTMIDITGIEDIQVGSEIIIFDNVQDIKRMAASMNTIPYEVLTSISQRVKRVYVYE